MTPEFANRSVWNRIRTYFLTGLLVLGPLVITAYALWKLFAFVDHLLGATLRGGYIRTGGVPGLGFLTVVVIIFVVGLLANNFLGRSIGTLVESMLMRVPIFRGFYSTIKQVGEALLGDRKGTFQRVVLVEFPSAGRYALGFVTSSVRDLLPRPGGKLLVAVFVPSVPNPTTGHLLFFAEEELIPTSLKVEQAVKMIISAGVVTGE